MKTLATPSFSRSFNGLLSLAAALGAALALGGCSGGSSTSAATGGAAGSGGAAGAGGAAGSAGMAGTGGTAGSAGMAGNGGAGGVVDPGPSSFVILDMNLHRNRLLDTLAQRRGAPDRCKLWEAMTIVEKGVFLTHTDMLGHRSCMENSSVPVEQMSNGKCDASGCTCTTSSPCSCPVASAMALDHVFKLWAVNGTDTGCCTGTNCCNGGGEWHRTFFSADDKLIGYLRDIHSGLPEWAKSNDFAGPHDPFSQSSETQQGTPRGQIHFWKQDSEAEALSRNGVEGVMDPHIVEIDNDYNILHDSNPEGFYSSTYGRAAYKSHWNGSGAQNRGDGQPTTYLGNGAPDNISEIANDAAWAPVCGPVIAPQGVAPGSGGNPGELTAGAKVVISGSGFMASGNRVHARSRSMAAVIDASSPLFLSESATSIVVQLPEDIGAGEGYVFVQSGGALTNLVPVTFTP